MDPREFPSDDRFSEWIRQYGTTGVKTYGLTHPANRGCVAVYREMTMNERQILARLEEVEDEHPGAYDYQRMIVSACLLHPTLESYPKPPIAAAEMFTRMRQHGHGPLEEEEEMVTQDKDLGAIPRHVTEDIKNARSAAYDVFHDQMFSSIYKDLIIELASGPDGQIDVHALDYLWGLSPGRIRDIAARVEQVHADVRREAVEFLRRDTDMDGEEKQQRAEMIEDNFASPMEAIDQVVGDAATPSDDEDEEESESDGPSTTMDQQGEEGELPPNRPPSEEQKRKLDQDIKEILDS